MREKTEHLIKTEPISEIRKATCLQFKNPPMLLIHFIIPSSSGSTSDGRATKLRGAKGRSARVDAPAGLPEELTCHLVLWGNS